MLITEVFKKSLPFTWVYQTSEYWYGTFAVNKTKYCISISHIDGFEVDGTIWDLSFGLEDDYFAGSKVIGSGGQEFAIFGTVINAFEEFLKTVKPERIMLSADKDNPNRFPLYQRIARRFAPVLRSMGYEQKKPPAHKHVAVDKYFDSLYFEK